MHELGIAQNIVEIVVEQANGQPVSKVRLEIGTLSAVVPDAIRFCFDICCKGTVLEGAELIIDEIEGRGKCSDCQRELPLGLLAAVCDCGSRKIVCIAGQELRVKEMEVA